MCSFLLDTSLLRLKRSRADQSKGNAFTLVDEKRTCLMPNTTNYLTPVAHPLLFVNHSFVQEFPVLLVMQAMTACPAPPVRLAAPDCPEK